jgi:flagellar biosynthesis/type III secretory pathway chaperone
MKSLLLFTACLISLSPVRAESPAPVVIQAIQPVQAAAPVANATTANAPVDTSASVLKALQQLKSANDEILKKQAATLQQLEDLGKAAEQIKIYSKRG